MMNKPITATRKWVLPRSQSDSKKPIVTRNVSSDNKKTTLQNTPLNTTQTITQPAQVATENVAKPANVNPAGITQPAPKAETQLYGIRFVKKSNGSQVSRFTTSESMDGQVAISPPGWLNGKGKSFEVTLAGRQVRETELPRL